MASWFAELLFQPFPLDSGETMTGAKSTQLTLTALKGFGLTAITPEEAQPAVLKS
jgi:hypothetical protein